MVVRNVRARATRKGVSPEFVKVLDVAQQTIEAIITYRYTGMRDSAWGHFMQLYTDMWLVKRGNEVPPLSLVRSWCRLACQRAVKEGTQGNDSLEDERLTDTRFMARNPENLVIAQEDNRPILEWLSQDGLLEQAGVPHADAEEWRIDMKLLLGDDIIGDSKKPYTPPSVVPIRGTGKGKKETYQRRKARERKTRSHLTWDGLIPARLDKLAGLCYNGRKLPQRGQREG